MGHEKMRDFALVGWPSWLTCRPTLQKVLWVQSPVTACVGGNQSTSLSHRCFSLSPHSPKSIQTYPPVRINKKTDESFQCISRRCKVDKNVMMEEMQWRRPQARISPGGPSHPAEQKPGEEGASDSGWGGREGCVRDE